MASGSARDVELKASYTMPDSTVSEDVVKLTIVDVELTATDLDGTVPFNEEETPGAHVHFNVDNDDASDNAVEAPKRPGADYANDTTPVAGENDLTALTVAFAPPLDEGSVVLTNVGSGDIWSSAQKGSGNVIIDSNSSECWDLSDPNEKAEFQSLGTVYVEGADPGTGNITLRYYLPSGGSAVDLDRINCTFIAADCGNRPTTAGSSNRRLFFKGAFPGLVHCEWSITGSATWGYNCIAYSVGSTTKWVGAVGPPEYGDEFMDRDYGSPPNGVLDINDVHAFYAANGLYPVAVGPNDAVAMYYSAFHGARKKSCGCGSSKNWIMFESKCGPAERIEHVWDQLNGTTYGSPTQYYK